MQTVTIGDETVKQETLVPLDEQDNPVTLYGGTVTIYEDGSADLVNHMTIIPDLSTQAWTKQNSVGECDRFRIAPSRLYPVTNAEVNVTPKAYCNTYKVRTLKDQLTTAVPWAFTQMNTIALWFYVPKDQFSTVDDFKATLGGVSLVYQLEEDAWTRYHFTNLEELKVWLGENNFWCDISDDISVKYWNRGFGN